MTSSAGKRLIAFGDWEWNLHGRSGRVALPRVKVVLAMAARLVAEGALALRAERMAELRRREVDIVICFLRLVN